MQSTAHLIDCMEGMPLYPDGYFDLSIPDPPYFSGPEKRRYYGKEFCRQGIRRRDYGITPTWEVPNQAFFDELRRVSRHQIIWGANYYSFIETPHKTPRRKDLAAWMEAHPTGWIVWDKVNEGTSYNDFELAWTSFDRPTVVFPFMWNGMMQGKSIAEGQIMQGNKKRNELRIHPTQKPVALYKWMLNQYALPGWSILDTHLGSGSSRIAAYELGHPFTGFEKYEVHFLKQERRFAQSIQQLKFKI